MWEESDASLTNEMVTRYQNVFSSPEGKKVLKHMLNELKFFAREVIEPRETALRDYATRLIKILSTRDIEDYDPKDVIIEAITRRHE
jgi:hypothetical protein